jgi:photosystem II stability/assembly factor-like uncharacterized protein
VGVKQAGRFLLELCLGIILVGLGGAALPAAAQPFDEALLAGMHWRLVGPFRGGRVVAVSGVPGQAERFYFGSVGGGVWRTDNAGRTWEPVFDGEPIASIGALAVAPSNPRILYAGSGEADMRSDISYGNGMYRSDDAGATWRRIGLEDSRQIGKILVHPRDPDLVYVAALGHAYGPNPERGVFRSRDGGRTWKRVLYRDDNTGAIDLAFDPSNPEVLFASLWQTRRPPWNVYPPSDGPGSGLYRSTDGGDSWSRIAGGFPAEGLGRTGIAVAPSDPRRVYAIVDAKEGGLYASQDGGGSWKRVNADRRIWARGWYFGGVAVDPHDANVVYACNTTMYRSTDGGKTFLPLKGAPGGDDYHQLWIDPADPRRMIVGSDQGAVVSVDGGATWSSWYNQPTAQLYHVVTDDRFPYWIYGAQQDSGAAAVPSRTDYRSISDRDWRPIAVGGENGYIAPDPRDANVLFGGTVGRFDQTTLQEQEIDPTLAFPGEYRHTWTLPLVFSPRNPNTLYFANQILFRTTDGGQRWTKISPDLTREDPGVPATLDPATAADSPVRGPRRGVIYTIAPSPLRDGWIWCGTDDGLVWLTRDEGAHWANVTPKALTPWSKVSLIEASRFEAGTAFAAVDRHRLEDLSPHIYRTRDAGVTWTEIARGIPAGSYVHAVREDPERRGLLYAGTETGVFVSFDEGDHWQPLPGNLPVCSVRDLAVRRGDLVIATHGRSFWVLDDLSPLRQLDADVASAEAWLFAPSEAVRLHPAAFQGTPDPRDEPTAENPPAGAIIDYALKSTPPSPVTIEILDPRGDLIRRFSSDDAPGKADLQRILVTPDWVPSNPPPGATAGAHRFVWNLRYPAPKEIPKLPWVIGPTGLWAPPGRYAVRLTAAGRVLTQPLIVKKDPRIAASDADLVRQFELARQIEAERVRVSVAARQAESLRKQLSALGTAGSSGAASSALEKVRGTLDRLAGPSSTDIPEELFDASSAAPTSLRRLARTLRQLQGAVESADANPTPDAVAGCRLGSEAAEQGLAAWREFLGAGLASANRALEKEGLRPLTAD